MNDQLDGWMDRGRHASFEQNTSSMPVLKERGRSFFTCQGTQREDGTYPPTYLPTQEMVTCMSLVGRFEFNVD